MSFEKLCSLERQYEEADTNINIIISESRHYGSLTDHDRKSIAFWQGEANRLRREHLELCHKMYGEEPVEIL